MIGVIDTLRLVGPSVHVNVATISLVLSAAHVGLLATIVGGVAWAQVTNRSAEDAPVAGEGDSPSGESENKVADKTSLTPASQSDEETQTRVRELIYVLRHCRVASRNDEWASAIRELASIGSPALPELLLELKNTERNATLRALLFTLRAIDDRRALPTVIEALPKAERLSAQGSDFRLSFVDSDLERFMKTHEHAPSKNERFSYGRPINEILGTLHKLAREPLPELNLRDLPASWSANYWHKWWQDHKTATDAADSQKPIRLPTRDDDLVERDGVRRFGPLFPTGPQHRLSPVATLNLPSVGFADVRPYLDLDSGTMYESLEGRKRQPGNRLSTNNIIKWLREYGIDLSQINVLDLHLWLIDNARWDSLEHEIKSEKPLELGREANSLGADDELRTFLFTTREGNRGVMRIHPPSPDHSLPIEYRLWNRDQLEAKPASQRPLSGPGEWQAEKFVVLKEPGFGKQCLYDFDVGKAAVLPEPINTEEQSPKTDHFIKRGDIFTDEGIASWARKEGIDLAAMRIKVGEGADLNEAEQKAIHNGQVATLSFIDVHTDRVTADAFETLSLDDAREILVRRSSPFRVTWMNPEIDPAAPPATVVFETKSGLIGLLQISRVGEDLSWIGFRYKLANTRGN